ncbi:methylated-DNA--[protein]-cysteine S-methyltransferase [Paenibacillus sp. MBLB4367]|uniref:methylated-DNA--[protein]-cysteine S-methyltransferase n=1 Tax=Paenibacillus sp. MBLB4367 TaxID=3384767 RepID=UPI003908013D
MTGNDDFTIYWTFVEQEGRSMYMAATQEGLCFAGSWNAPFEELEKWAKTRLPKHRLLREDGKLSPYAEQFAEYEKGNRTSFECQLDLRGTPFQMAVWEALCEIPYGRKNSYSDVAERIGKPKAVRAVGAAIGLNPVLVVVPCHRVIGKNGSLTGYRGGLAMKEALLKLEGQ